MFACTQDTDQTGSDFNLSKLSKIIIPINTPGRKANTSVRIIVPIHTEKTAVGRNPCLTSGVRKKIYSFDEGKKHETGASKC